MQTKGGNRTCTAFLCFIFRDYFFRGFFSRFFGIDFRVQVVVIYFTYDRILNMKKIIELMTLNISYQDNVSYRRIILVVGTMIATIVILLLFGVLNLFVLNKPLIAFFDFMAASITIFSLLQLKKTHNIKRAAEITTLNLIVFLLLFSLLVKGENFGLIWSIFLPLFATLANGKTKGAFFSLLFYTILIPLAYSNIEIWNHGEWNFLSWIRFSIASILLVIVMYINEASQEKSDKELEKVRQNEQRFIEQLHHKAITDQLTNLYNRRYYNEMVPQLLSLASRQQLNITFFILDVDYFKNYNDRYGHIQGDKALEDIAYALKRHIQRDDDFVFRLGGEEFGGIILSKEREKAQKWVQQLCSTIESLQIKHESSKVSKYLTVSIGIATICERDNYDLDYLYNIADKALYKAKEGGRNRCETISLCD